MKGEVGFEDTVQHSFLIILKYGSPSGLANRLSMPLAVRGFRITDYSSEI
jgi:hypothetical protein